MDEDRVFLMEKSQVFVYEIPPNYRIRGLSQRAADWNIGQPVWFGKLLIHKIGQWRCHLELRDVDGRIYGSASIRDYPSRDFEPVIDSSRYFTLGMSDSDGNVQLVGIGFVDRRDSSDVHHVVEDLFLTLLSNNNNEDTIAKTETQRTEKVFPVNAIMTQNEPVVEMLLETPVLSIDEPLEVESVEENSKTTGVINKEATASPMRDTFADDILLEEVQFSKPSTEIKELEEMTDNVLVHDEVQVYHPWPEPQIPEKLNQTRYFKVLKCTFCLKIFQTRHDLIQHFRETHADPEAARAYIFSPTTDHDYRYISSGMFKCDMCTERFSSSSNIMEHWKTVHNVPHLSCSHCGLPFRFVKELEGHNQRFHSIPCRVCGELFFNRRDSDEHLLTRHLCNPEGKTIHRACKKDFSCNNCSGWFDFRSHRWLHIKEKHDVLGKGKLREVVTSCPECNVVPANTSELRKHVRSDHRYPKKRASKLTMDPPTHVHETKNSPFISKRSGNVQPLGNSYSACELRNPTRKPSDLRQKIKGLAYLCPVCPTRCRTALALQNHLFNSHSCDSSGTRINTRPSIKRRLGWLNGPGTSS